MSRRGLLPVVAMALLTAGCSRPARTTDPMALLRLNQDAMFALSSYRADCFTELTYDGPGKRKRCELATLIAKKPNLMRYDMWAVPSLPPAPTTIVSPRNATCITFACDGKTKWSQFGPSWGKDPRIRPEDMGTISEPWDGFYSASNSVLGRILEMRKQGSIVEISYGGTATVDGILCDEVLTHDTSHIARTELDQSATYYIGQADHLIRRKVEHVVFDRKRGFVSDAILRHIELNPVVKPAVFTYAVPAGVSFEGKAKRPTLLASGKVAPGFSASDANRHLLKLSDFRGKVVVIDFWASWCMPCRESMPHTEQVAKTLTDAGIKVVCLAIDDGEPRAAFDGWVSSNQAKYPTLVFAHADPSQGISAKLYKVSGIPTQYVLDSKGVIRATFVGYGGPTPDLENAIRAAAKQ